ncbi:FUSC family protein, partial [Methylobacterium sp. WL122]
NAGLALNDLEAALSRALQQPRAGHHPEVEAAMVADATLRRISARLTVLRHAGAPTQAEDGTWKAWIAANLQALAENRYPLPDRPGGARSPQLQRLVAQVDLLTGTLRPGQVREAVSAVA